MNRAATSATRELAGGSARVFLAEAVSLPTAIIIAAYLARHFGRDDYGLYTLAVAIVVWLEWTLVSLFSRAAVKLVADAEDWRPAGAAVLRVFGIAGLIGGLAVWLGAGSLGTLMHEPTLARYLRLLALDIPLFLVVQAHQQILVGTGAYARRASVAACRWLSRAVLVIGLVIAGFGIEGALAGIIGASVVELMVARRFVRPGLRGGGFDAARGMASYALPLFVSAVSLRLFDKIDLFMLKGLGGSAALAGIYGAAQNLTVIPNLIALAVTTLLLSTLSRAVRTGDDAGARLLVHNATRGVLLMVPFAGVGAAAATELAVLIFGAPFASSGPLVSMLIFASVALVMISVSAAIVTAAGHARYTLVAALPTVPLAVVGHTLAIPRFGASGAAVVTVAVAGIGAVIALGTVHRAWKQWLPAATLARVAVVTPLAIVLGSRWAAPGPLVVIKLAALSLGVVATLVLLGELSPDERRVASVVVNRVLGRREVA